MTIHTTSLSDGELYDVIVDVVGEGYSLEFCTLTSHFLDGNDLDVAMRANGTDWKTIGPLVDEVREKAAEKQNEGDEQ